MYDSGMYDSGMYDSGMYDSDMHISGMHGSGGRRADRVAGLRFCQGQSGRRKSPCVQPSCSSARLGPAFSLLDRGLCRLVPRQATFARFTSSRSAWSWALRFRQAM